MFIKSRNLFKTVRTKPSVVALHEFSGGSLHSIKELFLKGDVPWAEHKCYDYLKWARKVSGKCVLVDRKLRMKTQSVYTDICACEFLWFPLINCGHYQQLQRIGLVSKTFIIVYLCSVIDMGNYTCEHFVNILSEGLPQAFFSEVQPRLPEFSTGKDKQSAAAEKWSTTEWCVETGLLLPPWSLLFSNKHMFRSVIFTLYHSNLPKVSFFWLIKNNTSYFFIHL